MGFGSLGWDMGLKSEILALRPGSGCSRDWGLTAGIGASRLGLGPQGWDWGLEAGIGALRPGLGPWGWDLTHLSFKAGIAFQGWKGLLE